MYVMSRYTAVLSVDLYRRNKLEDLIPFGYLETKQITIGEDKEKYFN